MKAYLEKIVSRPEQSYRIFERRLDRFDAPWHFHPEIELTLILASSGRRFVGDSIESFSAGDLVLLGPNVPHFWHNEGGSQGQEKAHSIVIQFERGFLGKGLWSRPELSQVDALLRRSVAGIHFSDQTSTTCQPILRRLLSATGVARVCGLLEVLEILAHSSDSRSLSTPSYSPSLNRKTEERLARVQSLLVERHNEPISLCEIARTARMAPAAFSRFFKRQVGRNVSEYLNDLRIETACRLLRETRFSVARIAGESGFQSLSNFNRRFQERRGCSPLAYRKTMDTVGGEHPVSEHRVSTSPSGQ